MIQLTNRSGSGITELVAGGRFPALSTRPKAGAGRSPSPWRPAPLHEIARSALPGVAAVRKAAQTPGKTARTFSPLGSGGRHLPLILKENQ